ncbi:MAG: Transposase B [Candidatus Gottesmanbacteria bacterium GW2011_GWB1_43_11]|uniref:Transposase B n=1 Tax=Candidatus Gottesmanbacteria bacterium GW2011_GWB1_43_11 TaxID=1618446 RepID=A0A0G1CJY1_9BACT|nr:MAG: Transposase B [Candidatus Gottesmanbacteria bacterium GW2011_GWA2_42_16]KKS81110.1 MAG: Transposase B [Candidatus Gottesmanbacteria bacterium GW2011_GWC1_43_10]KKS85797.1 MAG: Transposase B [Candidatus Gottesmanbacteria bacterium GW2011_GWB1_43_11]OGG09993.1 MAG: hypothetical protein A2699_04170 [Candidatus Gottesmanbacteria bacterium RIFCSPHIGHO2_01_FULL_43_15]OGG25342.1 MAG: hypothetical protein A3A59_02775 [Candidatus Gottesmanbacteria bacterium RIFCSPLOWO2_01_FULL_42_10]
MYYDVTKLVSKKVFTNLLLVLPTPRQKRFGRKRVEKKPLIAGILQVLKHGLPWNSIAACGASGVSCWRYFQEIQRRGKLKLIYEALAGETTDVVEGAIDTTTATSFHFRRLCGYDGKHRKYGTKISLFSDKGGLPADVNFGKGQAYDGVFVAGHLKKTAGRRKRVLNLDKMYTNLEMRRRLRKSGTQVNMEMRKGDYIRKRGPKFSFNKEKYQVRFLIERLNAWIKNFWRVRVRRDYKPAIYKAFVYLALIIVLLRQN